MKILFDTSVLLPGFRYPELREKAIGRIIHAGALPVVTDYILDELRSNIQKKYTAEQKAVALDLLLQILSMGVLEIKTWAEYAPHLDEALKLVPEKDAPVLAAAMLPDIDLLLTNDKKHFLENQKLQETAWREKIKTAREFLELPE